MKDLEATIKAMDSAIKVMQGASKTDSLLQAQDSVRQALAFLSMKTNDEQRNVLMNFVSADPERSVACSQRCKSSETMRSNPMGYALCDGPARLINSWEIIDFLKSAILADKKSKISPQMSNHEVLGLNLI